jgi:hypothetical protein
MFVSGLAYSSILKVESLYFYETSVDFRQTAQRYILENRALHRHLRENIKSNKL